MIRRRSLGRGNLSVGHEERGLSNESYLGALRDVGTYPVQVNSRQVRRAEEPVVEGWHEASDDEEDDARVI